LQATIAVTAFLVGLTLGLKASRKSGSRAVLLHAGAIASYVVSVLAYQIAFGLIVIAGALYLSRARWRRALAAWAAELIVVIPVATIAAAASPKPLTGLDIERFGAVYEAAFHLLPATAFAWNGNRGSTELAVALLALPVAAMLATDRAPAAADLHRWLLVALGAIVAMAAGYFAILPTGGYSPLSGGPDNRVNLAASLGAVTFVYADVMLVSLLARRRGRGWQAGLLALAALVIICGYVRQLVLDEDNWQATFNEERKVLSAVRQIRPAPPKGAVVYVDGYRRNIPYLLPFYASWDTRAAVKLTLGPRLEARPLFGDSLVCTAKGVYPLGLGPRSGTRYGQSALVDVQSGLSRALNSRRDCTAANRVRNRLG
jgi:hypothetical protein